MLDSINFSRPIGLLAITSYGQFLSLLLPGVLNIAVNNLALQRCTLCTEVNDDVPSPADGVTDVTLRPIVVRLVGPVGRPSLGVNAHFALNQGWSIDDERKPSLATKGSVLCLFAWSPLGMAVLQCVWLYSSAVKQAYIRMMARSLWFLPTFYNFPREMLCASGPNLQKQFKHQRLLLLCWAAL